MVERRRYDGSPAAENVPLTDEELDFLLRSDATYFLRDPRRLRHLLTRVKAAFVASQRRIRSLQRDVEIIREQAQAELNPVAVALRSLRALTADEQREVYGVRARSFLEALASSESAVVRSRLGAANEANRVRFALGSLLDDPDIPLEVRAKVNAALRLLPESVPAEVVAVLPLGIYDEVGFAVEPVLSSEEISDALFG